MPPFYLAIVIRPRSEVRVVRFHYYIQIDAMQNTSIVYLRPLNWRKTALAANIIAVIRRCFLFSTVLRANFSRCQFELDKWVMVTLTFMLTILL